MRGRTNILPLVGGYVLGDTIECEVAETNGIRLGDFVQFEYTDFQNSDVALPYPTTATLNESVFLKVSGEDVFVSVTVEYISEQYALKVYELSLNENSFELQETTLLTGFVAPIVGFFKVEQDKVLVITRNNNVITNVFFVYKNLGEWTYSNVQSVDEGIDVNFIPAGVNKPIGTGKFIASRTLSGKYYAVVIDFDVQNLKVFFTATEVGVSFVTQGNSSAGHNYLTCGIFNETYNLYLSGDGKLFSIQGSAVSVVNSSSIGRIGVDCNIFQLDVNKYVIFKSNLQSPSNAESNFIVEFNSQSVTITTFEIDTSEWISNRIVKLYDTYVGVRRIQDRIEARTFVFDEENQTVLLGNIVTLYNDGFGSIVNEIGDLLKMSDGKVILEYAVGSEANRSLLFGVSNGNVSSFEDITKVVKRVNAIDGIARTSGNAGDTIQVYVPSNS